MTLRLYRAPRRLYRAPRRRYRAPRRRYRAPHPSLPRTAPRCHSSAGWNLVYVNIMIKNNGINLIQRVPRRFQPALE